MIKAIKNFLLDNEPFKPIHMGMWVRLLYFKYYLKKFIDFSKINYALDAGCGKGYYTKYLAEILPNISVVGYDINRQPGWEGYKNNNLIFEQRDLNLLEEKDKYNLIISVDSLEHISDNKKIIEKFYSALTINGYFYFHIPCESQEKYIFPKKFFKEIDEWAEKEHIGKQYSLAEWKNILENFKFKVLLARYTFTFWGHLAWEIETILRLRNKKFSNIINIILMPFYKFLGVLDLLLPTGKGNNLLIVKK